MISDHTYFEHNPIGYGGSKICNLVYKETGVPMYMMIELDGLLARKIDISFSILKNYMITTRCDIDDRMKFRVMGVLKDIN